MTFGLDGGDDALDVLTSPCRDGRTQIPVSEAVEATCEDAIEGVHQDLHGVLHGVVEGFSGFITVAFRFFDGGFVLVALCHQVFKQRWHHAFAVIGQPKLALDGRDVVPSFFGSGLSRVDPRGVTDVVADHDGGVHALEIEHGNPRVEPCFHIVHVAARDLAFFCFGRTGERDGYMLVIRKTNDKRINELAGAAVGCGFKRHFRNGCYRLFSSHSLNRTENVEREFSISDAIGHDFIRTVGPLLVHVRSVHVHLVLVLVVGEEEGGNEREGLAPGAKRLPCLPPGIHHYAPRKVPGTIALALGNQCVSIPLEFGFQPRSSPPTKQICGAFPTTATLEHARSVCQTREVKIVNVVAGDDIGVGGLHRGGQSFQNLDLGPSILKHLAFTRS